MERRAAMRLLTGLSTGAVLPAASVEALFSGVKSAIARPEELAVEDWEQIVWESGFLYQTRSSKDLLAATVSDVAEVSHLLRRVTSPDARRGLLRVSAQLAALLGSELDDIGHHGASLRSWMMARHAADASDDRDLRVWVRAREAMYGVWTGRPDHVLARIVDDAVQIADGVPSSALARALGMQAIVTATQGDAGKTRAALDALRRTYDGLSDEVADDRLSPLWSFPERRLLWALAYPLALIGDTLEASRATDEALRLFPADFCGTRADLGLIGALSLVRDREVGEGLSQAITATRQWPLGAPRRRIISQILSAVPEKARELPAARELRALTA